ncbi:MAG: aminotransferase class IV [Saprospiraceae bacterium]|nr:aminotransferase class IV [Saprospiraceae bacterium]
MQINLNGHLLPDDAAVFGTSNRSFRYGDGLFETMRVVEGKLPFWYYHWQRLNKGLDCLGLERSPHHSSDFFLHEIAKLTKHKGNWRIRLSLWRAGGGLYTPEQNLIEFLIEASPLPSNQFLLNEKGLNLLFYPNETLPVSRQEQLQYFNFKLASSIPFVLAANFKKANGIDDCILFNTEGRLGCASSANIFLVKNGELFTPALTEGCVAGTMRSAIMDIAKALEMRVLEQPISKADLFDANEIFLTNAIQGIRWVNKIADRPKTYSHGTSAMLVAKLNEKLSL